MGSFVLSRDGSEHQLLANGPKHLPPSAKKSNIGEGARPRGPLKRLESRSMTDVVICEPHPRRDRKPPCKSPTSTPRSTLSPVAANHNQLVANPRANNRRNSFIPGFSLDLHNDTPEDDFPCVDDSDHTRVSNRTSPNSPAAMSPARKKSSGNSSKVGKIPEVTFLMNKEFEEEGSSLGDVTTTDEQISFSPIKGNQTGEQNWLCSAKSVIDFRLQAAVPVEWQMAGRLKLTDVSKLILFWLDLVSTNPTIVNCNSAEIRFKLYFVELSSIVWVPISVEKFWKVWKDFRKTCQHTCKTFEQFSKKHQKFSMEFQKTFENLKELLKDYRILKFFVARGKTQNAYTTHSESFVSTWC